MQPRAAGGRDGDNLQQPDPDAQTQLLIQDLNQRWNLGISSPEFAKLKKPSENSPTEDIISDLMTRCSLEMQKQPLERFEVEAVQLCSKWNLIEPVRDSLSLTQRSELVRVLHEILHVAVESASEDLYSSRHRVDVHNPPALQAKSTNQQQPNRARDNASPDGKGTSNEGRPLNSESRRSTLKLSINPVPPLPNNPDGVTETASARSQESDAPSSSMSGGIPDQYFVEFPLESIEATSPEHLRNRLRGTIRKSFPL